MNGTSTVSARGLARVFLLYQKGRDSRNFRLHFGSPLVLSRVHWVRPELVAEVKYLTWTDDNLLRQVVYEGLREDKPAAEVRRLVPFPKPAATISAVSSRQRRR